MWTAQEGHTSVARLLLERGAMTMTRDEVCEWLKSVHDDIIIIRRLATLPFFKQAKMVNWAF